MRKLITGIVALLLLFTISFLVAGIVRKSNEKEITDNRISSLPVFTFVDLTGEKFSSGCIREGPVLIVKFHPECEHCQYEISEILRSKIPGSGIKVLLITNAGRKNVLDFLSQFDITGYHNIIPLIDTAFIFSDVFGKDLVPSNYIYNKELKLVKALYGEYKIEKIQNLLGLGE